MVLSKPKIKGKEIKIATAFYKKRRRRPDPGMSPMLASLVTNQAADVLATAYAPPSRIMPASRRSIRSCAKDKTGRPLHSRDLARRSCLGRQCRCLPRSFLETNRNA